MPRELAPGAVLTQEQADELDDLLADFAAKHQTAINARDALYSFVAAASSPFDEDECVDFFGDGRAKRRAGCTLPKGMVPPRMIPNRATDPAERAAQRALDRAAMQSRLNWVEDPSERRHPDAAVPPGLMLVATNRQNANNAAWLARKNAAEALNVASQAYGRPAGVPIPQHSMVDVFGDGRIKPIAECTFPEGTAPLTYAAGRG